jgi:hypothetical protein
VRECLKGAWRPQRVEKDVTTWQWSWFSLRSQLFQLLLLGTCLSRLIHHLRTKAREKLHIRGFHSHLMTIGWLGIFLIVMALVISGTINSFKFGLNPYNCTCSRYFVKQFSFWVLYMCLESLVSGVFSRSWGACSLPANFCGRNTKHYVIWSLYRTISRLKSFV